MNLKKSASEVVSLVQSGQRVFVHGGAATPTVLLRALVDQYERLSNVELIHLHTEGAAFYASDEFKKSFRIVSLFVGGNLRGHLDYDRIDYLPCFLSEIPKLFSLKQRPLDVALVHVSPPDKHGFCTLGTSVDIARSAVNHAKTVIAQVNHQMPRVHGDGFVHIDHFDAYVEVDEQIPQIKRCALSEVELSIGKRVADLIDDGATLQAGIGAIPDAVLTSLKNHRHLGVHTEMWSHGTLDLIKAGVVDNLGKTVHPGKTISAFVLGDQELYDFIHDNPSVVQLDAGYVNDPGVIRRNPKVTAINSAVEVDLTGQVCADSIGSQIISGVGGQMDFMRGATLSHGGKAIIAMTSRTKKGIPRIVPTLRPGAGVVTTRAHVHFVVTEYGVADLYGKTLKERADALVKIAHPQDRAILEKARHV